MDLKKQIKCQILHPPEPSEKNNARRLRRGVCKVPLNRVQTFCGCKNDWDVLSLSHWAHAIGDVSHLDAPGGLFAQGFTVALTPES